LSTDFGFFVCLEISNLQSLTFFEKVKTFFKLAVAKFKKGLVFFD
jgi:hypothetical protein